MKFIKVFKNSLWIMFLSGLVVFDRCAIKEDEPEFDKELLLQLVNSYRASGCNCGSEGYFVPTVSLEWNDILERAAHDHCVDMFTNKFFSHTGSDGSDVGTRLNRRGYKWKTCGENISSGRQTEKSVIDGWMKSPGHCRNIMNPTFKEIGASRKDSYWTLVLGTR